jgi:competence protein ComEC
MLLRYLALCLAGGILAADAGILSSRASSGPSLAAVLTGVAAVIAVSRRSRVWRSIPIRLLGAGLAGVVVFGAGGEGITRRFEQAALDAKRALEVQDQGIRLAEARVSARRIHGWGVDVTLSEVVAADGGSALPRRLILAVPDRRESAGGVETRADEHLLPGVHVRLGLRVRPLDSKRNPGGVDREHTLRRRGLAARARLADPNWVVVRATPPSAALRMSDAAGRARDDFRQAMARRLARAGDDTGLVRALALGDRSGLSVGGADDFRALGLSHLLAVSGLHVGMVAGLCAWITRRAITWLRPQTIDPFLGVFAAAVLSAGAYAWLTGAGVSVQRAWGGLFVLWLFARLRRAPDPAELLAGIALVLCLADPATLFDLGAQLSFAACGGLIAAGIWRSPTAGARAPKRISGEPVRWIDRIREHVASGMRVSCAAGFATGGVLIVHGLGVAGWSPVANAIAVPWTAFLVLPTAFGSLALVAGRAVFETACGHEAFGDVPFETNLLFAPSEALVGVSHWAALRTPTPPTALEVGSALPILLVAGLGLLALRHDSMRGVLLCWGCLTMICVVVRADHGDFAERPRVWFFDVGQGDAALVEGRRASVLIDAGPGPADGSGGHALVGSLRALGLGRLDLLVVTHADLDHRGGAIRVLEGLEVSQLWLPSSAQDDPALGDLLGVAQRRGTRVSWRSASREPLRLGDLQIETLWPARTGSPTSRNAGSLVLRVRVSERAFLFLADVDTTIEERLDRDALGGLRADYLKVSHHGSRNGTSADFLASVRARHAIVSSPCRSNRGLPNEGTLDRIRASPTRLWWTGRDGAVVVYPGRSGRPDEVLAWAAARDCRRAGRSARDAVEQGDRPKNRAVALATFEDGRAFLDERALGLACVLGFAQWAAEFLLAAVGALEIHPLELANAAQRRLHGQGCVARDLIGGLEGACHQLFGIDQRVQQTDLERAFGIDRLRRVDKLRRMHGRNLLRKQHRRLTGRVEAERDLLEREGRGPHRESNLGGEHEIEATGPGVSIDGDDERDAEWLLREGGVADGAHSLEIDRVDLFASCQGLGDRDGLAHVHARAKDPIAGAGEDRHADRGILVDPLPVTREISQGLGIKGIGAVGAIDRDHSDVGVARRSLEAGRHAGPLGFGRAKAARRAKRAKLAADSRRERGGIRACRRRSRTTRSRGRVH